MMRYFKDVDTLESLRSQYKKLIKKWHPDNVEGSEEATKAINAEYEELFKLLKDRHEKADKNADSSDSDYDNMKWNFEEDARLRKVLQRIIGFTGINIELIGCWIWIDGNTYAYKNHLKELGFKWAREKKKWYFHTESFRKKSRKKLSIDDIRNYYGTTEFRTESRIMLQA